MFERKQTGIRFDHDGLLLKWWRRLIENGYLPCDFIARICFQVVRRLACEASSGYVIMAWYTHQRVYTVSQLASLPACQLASWIIYSNVFFQTLRRCKSDGVSSVIMIAAWGYDAFWPARRSNVVSIIGQKINWCGHFTAAGQSVNIIKPKTKKVPSFWAHFGILFLFWVISWLIFFFFESSLSLADFFRSSFLCVANELYSLRFDAVGESINYNHNVNALE